MNSSNESRVIFEALQELGLGMTIIPGDRVYPGYPIDGITAIEEMRDAGYPFWREMEWPAYYIAFLLERQLAGRLETIRDGKFTTFKGEYR